MGKKIMVVLKDQTTFEGERCLTFSGDLKIKSVRVHNGEERVPAEGVFFIPYSNILWVQAGLEAAKDG